MLKIEDNDMSIQIATAGIDALPSLSTKDAIEYMVEQINHMTADSSQLVTAIDNKVSRVNKELEQQLYKTDYVRNYISDHDANYYRLNAYQIQIDIKGPKDWQFINFTELSTFRSTILSFTMVKNTGHHRINEIYIKTLKQIQRKQPQRKNLLLIKYLTKQLEYWRK